MDEDYSDDNIKVQPEVERPSDQEILETIDSSFFSTDDHFDAQRYELKVSHSFDIKRSTVFEYHV